MNTERDERLFTALAGSQLLGEEDLDRLRREWATERSRPDANLAAFLVRQRFVSPAQLLALVRDSDLGSGTGTDPGATMDETRVAPTSRRKRTDEEIGPGQRIGSYELEAEIGRGGIGVVYRARDERTGAAVAVKVLSRTGGRVAARFEREGRIVTRLDHPNIVRVHEAGEADGVHYVAMDLVEGAPLGDILPSRQFTVDESLSLIGTLARAVDHAHRKGIIHRDLKPDNVLIGSDGEPRLLDFGLARDLDGDDDNLTRTGQPMGTPHYMSPEQVRGDKRRIARTTDVHALGVMLYEMLSGRRPFVARSRVELYQRIQSSAPIPLARIVPGLPAGLDAICRRALAKDPARRFGSAGQLADALDDVRAGRGFASGSRRPIALAAGLALVLSGLIVVGVLVARSGGGGGERTPDVPPPTADWPEHHAAFVAAIEAGDVQTAKTELGAMDAAGVPGAVRRSTIEAARTLIAGRVRDSIEAGHGERAAGLLAAARDLLGDDATLADLAWQVEGVRPVELDVRPAGSRVAVEPVDPAGEAVDLGRSPLPSSPLAPGRYRLTVETPDGTRHVQPLLVEDTIEDRQPLRLAIDLTDRPDGMVLVGATGAASPDEPPPFWIDRTEVDLGRFARFVGSIADRGGRLRQAPFYFVIDARSAYETPWRTDVPPPTVHDLPVTAISPQYLKRFLRATGRRLPTASEWVRAARGIDDRPYPWGDRTDGPPGAFGLEFVAPVGSHPDDVSPFGVLDLGGNVRELTTGPGNSDYHARGGSIDDDLAHATIDVERDHQLGQFNFVTGFRTALSQVTAETTADIVAGLRHTDAGARHAMALLAVDRPLDPEIENALFALTTDDPDSEVRYAATRALRDRASRETVDSLVRMAQTPGDRRARAVRALLRIVTAANLPLAVPWLASKDRTVGWAVFQGLEDRREPSILPACRDLLASPGDSFQAAHRAAGLLAVQGDPKGLEYLLERLDAAEGVERLDAAYHLWWLAHPASVVPLMQHQVETDGKNMPANIRYLLGVLVRDGTALPPLREGLSHPDPRVRRMAAFELGKARDAESRVLLEERAASDDSPEVRQSALKALERLDE